MSDLKAQYRMFVDLLQKNIQLAVASYIKPKYQVITAAQLRAKVNEIFPGMALNLYDMKYQLTHWTTWLTIMEFDWTEQKKYVTDFYDCDNFSGSFCSRASEFFNLNTAGRFTCQITTDTGEKIAHRAVLIAAIDENDALALYVIESQNDGWTKVTSPSQTIIIPNNYGKNWRYQGNLSEFN